MGEWKEYRFSDFVKINPPVKLDKGEHSFVEMKDLFDGQRYCSPSMEREMSGGARFNEGDTLFARITPCLENGKICQVKGLKEGEGFGSTEFFVFRGIDGVSDNDFVYYLSRWDEVRAFAEMNFDGTSGRQRVPKNAFNNLFLNLPDLPEQKSIASILSSLDDKIDLLHRQNKTLEALAETIFMQWFVEEAEEGIKNGQVYKIDDLIATISQTYRYKESEQVVFLNTSDIYAGQVLNHAFYDVSVLPGQAKKSIQKNDILYSEIRPENKRYAFIDFDASMYVVSTKLMVLRGNGLVGQSIIYFYLTHPQTLSWLHMLAEARSGTFPQITFDQIKEMKINIPPVDLLTNITAWTDSTLNKICKNNQQIGTLSRLRDMLLPKLMNGEARVRDAGTIV